MERHSERQRGEGGSRREAGLQGCEVGEAGICQPGWPAGVSPAALGQSFFLLRET